MISAINSTGVAPYLSQRYVRIDTAAVIAALKEEGYEVAGVRQDRVQRRDPQFARHEVDFRHPDMGGKLPDGTTPRVLFINSHNGTARAQFLLGMFRMICSNGMIVGSTWARERVLHVGDGAKDIVARIREASKNTGKMFATVEAMSKKELSKSQQQDLARAATELRFGKGGAERYDPEQLLLPQRAEDDAGDLWRTFNRIQENGTRLRLTGRAASGRAVTSRGLNGISADHKWNRELWNMAEQLVAA